MTATSTPRIRLEDLPAIESLTEEELARIFGAGPRRFQLGVEQLENREVMTTSITTSVVGSTLNVYGAYSSNFSNRIDNIRVAQSGNTFQVFDGANNRLLRSATGISRINVYGYGGNDIIDLSRVATAQCWAYGGDGNDLIRGGGGRDFLFGGNGVDKLYGNGGNDWLEAGTASEIADGGAGTDWNAHIWAIGGATMNDIRQQGSPTCSFLASLSIVAGNGTNLASRISYLGNFNYRVQMYRNGSLQNFTVRFDGSTSWNDPGSAAEGESWTIIYQRAYLQIVGGNGSSWPYQALYALTGKTAASVHRNLVDSDFDTLRAQCAAYKNVVCATKASGVSSNMLVGNHAYSVWNAWTDSSGNKWVQIRNPWAVDGGAVASGNANDGWITLSWATFKANMQGFWYN